MSQTKTIVIGTSLSKTSDDIVRAGVAIAESMGAKVWLAHAYTLQVFPSEIGTIEPRWIEEQQEALRENLVLQAQRTGLAGLAGFGPGNLHLAADSPSRAIVDLARQVEASLIVIGAAESGAVRRLLLGSTADGVVRQAPCPVLVVRSASAFPPARVEIAVDLSPSSALALRQGLALLGDLGVGPSETEALFVLSPLEVESSLHFTPEQVERFAKEELHRFLAENGAHLPLARLRIGYPWDEIVAVLDERKADLVVLGTHGRRGFDRLLLGSVATGVMHRAACNVLVVPPGAACEPVTAGEKREQLDADWRFVSDEVATPVGQA